MMKLCGIVLTLMAVALVGCSSLGCGDPHPYLNSGTNPPLKAPRGLSVPAPDPAYAIAGVTATAGKRTDLNSAGACLINPPQVVPPAAAAAGTPKAAAPALKPEPAPKPAQGSSTPAPAAATSSRAP